MVGDLNDEAGGILPTNEAGHQDRIRLPASKFMSAMSGGADELVVHEHPGTLGLGGLLGNFVLCHLDGGVPDASAISTSNFVFWSMCVHL